MDVPHPGERPSVLVVCTANICRSPAAARLLGDLFGPVVTVASAGVEAFAGAPVCAEASQWLTARCGARGGGRHRAAVPEHASRRLDAEQVRAASLVLTATRAHRRAVLRLVPAAQVRTFTLAQAARLADWCAEREPARPVKAAGPELLGWLVSELDSARGLAPMSTDEAADDVPDPHVDGVPHGVAMPVLYGAVSSVARLLTGHPLPAVAQPSPATGTPPRAR